MSDGLEALRTQTRYLLDPVSVTLPAGTHDPEDALYLQLTDAAARLDSPSAATLDWNALARAAGTVLEKRNKDLLAAALYALADYRTRGIPGLAFGTLLLADLFDGYWSSLHPPPHRVRARGNALRLFVDRVVREAPPAGWAPEAVGSAGAAIDELVRRVEQLFPEETSAVDRLARWFDEQVRTRERWSRPMRPTMIDPPDESQENHAQAASARAARESLPATLDALFETATTLRRADPTDPQPYRLARASVWLAALAAPPADATGRTNVVAPLRSLREFLDTAESAGQWARVLDEVEQAQRLYPFWLDAQRLAATALGALGSEFAGARAAVEQETRALLIRLADVSSRRFADGTPFADERTVAWLARIGSSADE